MSLLSAITPDDVKAWQEIALAVIAAIGVVGTAFVVMTFALVYLVKSRMDALHGTQQTMQSALNAVQTALPATAAAESAVVKAIEQQTATLAVPSGPVAPPAPRALKIDPAELAALLKPAVHAAVAEATAARTAYPLPSQQIPPKP